MHPQSAQELDGKRVPVVIEQEPGAAGKIAGEDFVRALAGWEVEVLRGEWNESWLDEFQAFPEGMHDDQVDLGSAGFAALMRRYRGESTLEEMLTVSREELWREVGQQAYMKESGLAVWEVMMIAGHHGMDAEKVAASLQRPLDWVQAAFHYYEAFREEIDQAIADNRMGYEALKRLLPGARPGGNPTRRALRGA